jgi:L-alanine-DL-glutamate epimerase-like enolase superfamily enzyme
MRLTRVSVLEFRRTLDGRSWNPAMRWTERRAPLLLLHAHDGTVGVGEAWSRQSEIAHVLDYLAAIGRELVGRDAHAAIALPEARGPAWVAPAASSALDMALHDLRAKHEGLPLWRSLGGNRARVAVYASGGLYRDGASDADLAGEMRRYVDAGFTAVKMKIGALPLPDDLRRVRAVREAIGAATLWVDAVNQLAPEGALAACRALAHSGADAIQAPVAFADVDTMARINHYALPVIAAEGEHDRERFRALVDADAVGCLQFCPGLAGGFSGGAQLCALAAARGLPSTPQCFSTAVMQAASLHFGAANRSVATVEYHCFHDHLAALLPDAMRTVVDGHVTLDGAPGLGIAAVESGSQPCGGEIVVHADIH